MAKKSNKPLTVEALPEGAMIVLKAGDKVVVRASKRQFSAVEVARLTAKCAEIFGEGNVLVVSDDVEFYALRQGKTGDVG